MYNETNRGLRQVKEIAISEKRGRPNPLPAVCFHIGSLLQMLDLGQASNSLKLIHSYLHVV